MNDDLEPRLRDAMHRGSLPPAPASLVDALLRVPDAPVRARRRGSRPVLGLLAAAVVLIGASALVLTGGSPPHPGPSAPTAVPSVGAGVPGLHVEYAAQAVKGVAPTPADMAAIASILRARINATGVAGATVATHDLVIVVDLPGVADATDVESVRRLLGRTGKIDFVPLGETPATVGQMIDFTKDAPLFGGDQIASATVGSDQNGQPAVDFVLKSTGARLFGDYTASHIGSYFAITLDGVVVSAPVIQNAITGGSVEITGGGLSGFGTREAAELAATMGSGQLPFPIVETSQTMTAPLSPTPSPP